MHRETAKFWLLFFAWCALMALIYVHHRWVEIAEIWERVWR